MHDIDPADLIEFATRWSELGDAVTEQVARVLEDPSCGSCWNEGSEHGVNPTAIELAHRRLRGLNGDLDELLETFLASASDDDEVTR